MDYQIEKYIGGLPKFEKEEIIPLRGHSKTGNWENFKKGLLSILQANTRPFTASLDLLRIMGYEDEAKEYRDKYSKVLEETVQKIMEYTNEEEKRIYRRESHTIDGVLAVIKGEEEDLIEILKGLKF